MSKNLPFVTLAVALFDIALGLLYATAAFTHPRDLWLVPLSLAFTMNALLGVAIGIKLRELGTRLGTLERLLGTPSAGQTI